MTNIWSWFPIWKYFTEALQTWDKLIRFEIKEVYFE